jgi:hypothetical protein
MRESQKRARLTLAYDALANLVTAVATSGEDDPEVRLSRTDIFTSRISRKEVMSPRERADMEEAMSKKDWQRDFLKQLIALNAVEESGVGGHASYCIGTNVEAIKLLLESVENDRAHVFDKGLRLSKLLWPRDVILPGEIPANFNFEDAEGNESEEPDTVEVPNEQGGTDTRRIARIMVSTEVLGAIKYVTELLQSNTKAVEASAMAMAELIDKSEARQNEATAALRKRFSDLEKTVTENTSTLNGVIRTVKEQSRQELQESIVVEIRTQLATMAEATTATKLLVSSMINTTKKAENSKVAELAVTMKTLVRDMNAAAGLFMDVTAASEDV